MLPIFPFYVGKVLGLVTHFSAVIFAAYVNWQRELPWIEKSFRGFGKNTRNTETVSYVYGLQKYWDNRRDIMETLKYIVDAFIKSCYTEETGRGIKNIKH